MMNSSKQYVVETIHLLFLCKGDGFLLWNRGNRKIKTLDLFSQKVEGLSFSRFFYVTYNYIQVTEIRVLFGTILVIVLLVRNPLQVKINLLLVARQVTTRASPGLIVNVRVFVGIPHVTT